MPREILPNGYYYTFLLFDTVFAGIFGVMAILNPMEGFAKQLPLGWDKFGDALVGVNSPRVALVSLLGGVMGPVWAITTFFLLRLAKNDMKDRPDLAEKVVRAHAISGAIVDPFHLVALLYYTPTELLLNPAKWGQMTGVGLAWLAVVWSTKAAWCAGWGRASVKEALAKSK